MTPRALLSLQKKESKPKIHVYKLNWSLYNLF